MNYKYCDKCGKKLIEIEIGGYSVTTGKPIVEQACPSLLCEHFGIKHIEVPSGLFALSDSKCIKCGKKFFDYGL